jgi:cytochrome c oxidase subunit 3
MLPRVLWLSTITIILSSMTFETARKLYSHGERRMASRFLLGTLSLGVAFLVLQVTAWRELVRQGAYLMNNPHGAFFYLFTGVHAVHLAGGLIALLVVVYGRNKRRELVNTVCYYWHFMGVLWLMLFELMRVVS